MPFLERFMVATLLLVFTFSSCSSCTTTMLRNTYINNYGQESIEPHKYYDSVVLSGTMPPGGSGSMGYATSWAVSPHHLVTAGHFCIMAKKMMKKKTALKTIRLFKADSTGKVSGYHEATIKVISPKYDLCILRSRDHFLTPLPLAEDFDLVQIGDKVLQIGAPKGYFPIFRDGRVFKKNAGERFHPAQREYMLISGKVEKGASGSPVMWNGHVIGVVVNLVGPNRMDHAGLAVRGDHLLEFVNKHINLEKLNKPETK